MATWKVTSLAFSLRYGLHRYELCTLSFLVIALPICHEIHTILHRHAPQWILRFGTPNTIETQRWIRRRDADLGPIPSIEMKDWTIIAHSEYVFISQSKHSPNSKIWLKKMVPTLTVILIHAKTTGRIELIAWTCPHKWSEFSLPFSTTNESDWAHPLSVKMRLMSMRLDSEIVKIIAMAIVCPAVTPMLRMPIFVYTSFCIFLCGCIKTPSQSVKMIDRTTIAPTPDILLWITCETSQVFSTRRQLLFAPLLAVEFDNEARIQHKGKRLRKRLIEARTHSIIVVESNPWTECKSKGPSITPPCWVLRPTFCHDFPSYFHMDAELPDASWPAA